MLGRVIQLSHQLFYSTEPEKGEGVLEHFAKKFSRPKRGFLVLFAGGFFDLCVFRAGKTW